MSIKKNYVNPTVAESSFRELIKDKPFNIDTGLLVHVVKNIAYHSFDSENIFEHKYIDGSKKVKLLHNVIPNRENAIAWKLNGHGSDYNLKLPAIVIPLNCEANPMITHGRISLSGPLYGPMYIDIQFKFKGSHEWSIIPVGTTNVLKVIKNILEE